MTTKHRINVETMPKTGRRVDPPRSKWTCSCGAGSDGKLMPPAEAHRQADCHVELAARHRITGASNA